jgi:hypothetical protein
MTYNLGLERRLHFTVFDLLPVNSAEEWMFLKGKKLE